MAQFFLLLGRRVEVHYRAGDVFLPATGTLVADSGRSIFLEEHFSQRGQVKTFRWEIPYPCIVRLTESVAPPKSPAPAVSDIADAGLAKAGLVPLKNRPEEA